MKLTILYFAALRERVGRESEIFETQDANLTIEQLRTQLAAQGREGLASTQNLCVAVNQTVAHANTNAVLQDGDEVAFFPPVTGG